MNPKTSRNILRVAVVIFTIVMMGFGIYFMSVTTTPSEKKRMETKP